MAGLVPAIHVVQPPPKETGLLIASANDRELDFKAPFLAHGVDGRDKPGHDGVRLLEDARRVAFTGTVNYPLALTPVSAETSKVCARP